MLAQEAPCYLLRKLLSRPPCFVCLGKLGDIMINAPAWYQIWKQVGTSPVVVTSNTFKSIFEGMSYVTCDPIEVSWWNEVTMARRYAETKYGHCIVGKWWDDPTMHAPPAPPGSKLTKLTMNNREIIIAEKDWDSYQASQWTAAGFSREDMMRWPLVFDRRSATREEQLRKAWFHGPRPKVLFSLETRGTSPFVAVPEMMNSLKRHMYAFDFIDLTRITAARIYDILGLMDHAAGLVVSDSALLHLACASKVPYVAYVNNGGAGSIPRGNCVAKFRYADVMKSLPQLSEILESWKVKRDPTPQRASLGLQPA